MAKAASAKRTQTKRKPTKLTKTQIKKVAQRTTDRAAREDARDRTVSGRRDRARAQKATAAFLRTNIAGLTRLKREFNDHLASTAGKVDAELKQRRSKALKLARGRKDALKAMVADRVAGLEAALDATVPDSSADRYLVNLPWQITGEGVTLDSSAIVPSNSWAKFKLDMSRSRGSPSVVFRFLWNNATDRYKLITVNGYVILHGYCEVATRGGFFAGDRIATFKMTPTMELQNWSTDPYPYFGKQEAPPVHIDADSKWVFDDADFESQAVFRGYDLEQSLVLIPPRTTVGLIMSVKMYAYAGTDSGRVQADFSTGPYMVGSPAVLVRVLS